MTSKTEDCLERIKRNTVINTIGEVKTRLNDCENVLVDEIKQKRLPRNEVERLKQQFAVIFMEKQDEIQNRYEHKGQSYHANPKHVPTGQRAIYKSQQKREY
jgi:hypothetical protein